MVTLLKLRAWLPMLQAGRVKSAPLPTGSPQFLLVKYGEMPIWLMNSPCLVLNSPCFLFSSENTPIFFLCQKSTSFPQLPSSALSFCRDNSISPISAVPAACFPAAEESPKVRRSYISLRQGRRMESYPRWGIEFLKLKIPLRWIIRSSIYIPIYIYYISLYIYSIYIYLYVMYL